MFDAVVLLKIQIQPDPYGGANFVPIAVPQICCLTSPLNSK